MTNLTIGVGKDFLYKAKKKKVQTIKKKMDNPGWMELLGRRSTENPNSTNAIHLQLPEATKWREPA